MADKRIGDFATLADAKDDDLLLVSSEDETYNVKVGTLKKAVKEFAEESADAAAAAAAEAKTAAENADAAARSAESAAESASDAAESALDAAGGAGQATASAAAAAEAANAAAEAAENAAAAAPRAFVFTYDDSGAADEMNIAVLNDYLAHTGDAAFYIKLGVITMPASVRRIGVNISLRADEAKGNVYYCIKVTGAGCLYEAGPKYDSEVDPDSLCAPTGAAVAEYVAGQLDEFQSSIVSNITIPAEGWERDEFGVQDNDEYPYYIDVPMDGARAIQFPAVALHNASLKVAEQARLCQTAEASDGKIRFLAGNIPTEDISATVALLPSAGAGTGASGDGEYVLPVATRATLGGIKLGAGLKSSADGTVSVTTGISDEDKATADDIESMLDEIFS